MEIGLEMLKEYGVPIVLLVAVLAWAKGFVGRVMDESQKRELRLMAFLETFKDVEDKIEEMKEEVLDMKGKVNEISNKQNQVLDKISTIGRGSY